MLAFADKYILGLRNFDRFKFFFFSPQSWLFLKAYSLFMDLRYHLIALWPDNYIH